MNSRSILTQAEYTIGDLLVRYQAPADRPSAWGLSLLPAKRAAQAVAPREWLDAAAVTSLPAPWNRMRAWEVDPLVHVHVAGDAYPGGFAQGRTLRNSATTNGLAVQAHTREDHAGRVVLRTELVAASGLACTHELSIDAATGVVAVQVSARNPTDRPLVLEYLGAFSLGGLTPFADDDAAGRLWVHRFRSAWSAEGRHEERRVEDLHLARSWTGHGVRSERFGQAGSLPVNGWFPVVGLEDRTAGLTWLAQLGTPGTWHLEIYRRADQLALAGGGPDRLAGEWRHALAPGESVAAPPAFLTVVAGNIDEACDRLVVGARERASHFRHPEPCEGAKGDGLQPHGSVAPLGKPGSAPGDALPVVFNEWCTSWGKPTHDSIAALAGRLAGSGVQYLVIDDGWAERPGDAFQQNGDWKVNRRAFPGGLRATTDVIRAHGLVPGLWFEFEAVNPGSAAWDETSHQLHRDGGVLQVGNRRFWDFRDPWVQDYLAERVLARLRDDGFGYLKVDNNDSIGPGVDGAASPGENLRQHLAGVQRFFARLQAELPALVIENCSSGGHRLEASMMALTAMSSFSDAHETPDIPLIAADLNRLVWSAQKQIWAVLHASDSGQRLAYTLAATFLGRMCLSGDVARLAPDAWNFVREAIAFYRDVAPVIRDGTFRTARGGVGDYQHPTGHQVVTIHDPASRKLVVVWHTFAGAGPEISATLPGPHGWRVVREFSHESPVHANGSMLVLRKPADWSGGVLLLEPA
jgi:alpha-galactosidase